MFYLNIGYRWNLLNVANLRGAIYLPSKFLSARNRDILASPVRQRFIDPQLYLCSLDIEECSKACTNLGSHPWYSTSAASYDSGELTRRDWADSVRSAVAESWLGIAPDDEDEIRVACRRAIATQLDAGLTEILIPAPLVTEREDEASTQAAWLDIGLEVAEELEVEQPLIATVFLHETVINAGAFRATGILATVADQISARENLSGVYIGIAQAVNRHPLSLPKEITRAYARLSQLFMRSGFEYIIINFADLFGYVCTGLGATAFATGPSQSLRRLSLNSFNDQSGGQAFPQFYSHRLAGELTTETDLDRIVERRLLARIRDTTDYSRSLIAELERGGSARNLRSWVESRNNLTVAQSHFIARLARLGSEQQNRTVTERRDTIREWLEEANANQLLVQRRLGDLNGKLAPVEEWLEVFDEFAS